MTLNVWLWIAQGLLAALFGIAGVMKSFLPLAYLGKTMSYARDLPRLTRFIGASELAGAIGMVFPIMLNILPWLTPLAAIGFVAIQVLAIGYHASRGETAMSLPINLLLLSLSAFVAWGRFDLFSA